MTQENQNTGQQADSPAGQQRPARADDTNPPQDQDVKGFERLQAAEEQAEAETGHDAFRQ